MHWVPGGWKGSWAQTLLVLQGLPRHSLKCCLELVQDFMLVTKATLVKPKRPKRYQLMSQLKTWKILPDPGEATDTSVKLLCIHNSQRGKYSGSNRLNPGLCRVFLRKMGREK